MNTTTKPLFEETLNIVFECFEKHRHGQPLLPMECLKNYQLIYDENNDAENILHDDNQVFSDRSSVRPTIREMSVRSSLPRAPSRIKSARKTTAASTIVNSDIVAPLTEELQPEKAVVPRQTKEIVKIVDNNIDYERLSKIKELKARYTFRIRTQSIDKLNGIKRSFSSGTPISIIQRKTYLDLKLNVSDKKINIKTNNHIIPAITEGDKRDNAIIIEEDEQGQQNQTAVQPNALEQNGHSNSANLCAVH